MDVAEESVSELSRLKEENKQLNEMVRLQNEQEHSSFDVPHEIRGRRFANDHIEDPFMHERISALMRENEQNNISMRTLQNENINLKSSIEGCSRTINDMHSEMTDLKVIAGDGVSRLRQRERSLLQERRRDNEAIMEMEKKLENANNMVRSLGLSSSRYQDAQPPGMFPKHYAPPPSIRGVDTPNRYAPPPSVNSLKIPQEHASRSGSEEVEYHATPSRASYHETKVVAQLTTEKELRCKAVEICAGVLANSKCVLEKRDSEIGKLRSQLFKLSHGRRNRDR